MSRNSAFCSFALFSIASLTHCFNKPTSSRDLISRAWSKNVFWIAYAIAYNCNGIKTLLGNGFSTFFIKSKPVFSNVPRGLPKNTSEF